MLNDIKHAKKSIYFESYIIDPDEIGMEFARCLCEKAKELNVRKDKAHLSPIICIFDGLGSPHIKSTYPQFEKMVAMLEESGVDVHIFNPPKHAFLKYGLLNVIRHPLISFFGRNHRKLLIVDNNCAYLGGMNISNMYYIQRDTHMRLTGMPVPFCTKSFFHSLSITKNYELHALSLFSRERTRKITEFILSEHIDKSIRFYPKYRSGFKILSNIPSIFHHSIRDEYLKCIKGAHQSINIINPYFVPGVRFIHELSKAAKRGVQVKLLLSDTDHPSVDAASHAQYKHLLKSGVRIFKYKKQGTTMVHAKTMTVDGVYSTVGSANLDYISLSLNYELNFFCANREISGLLNTQFEKDLKYTTEVTLSKEVEVAKAKGFFERTKERIAYYVLGRFLSPPMSKYE